MQETKKNISLGKFNTPMPIFKNIDNNIDLSKKSPLHIDKEILNEIISKKENFISINIPLNREITTLYLKKRELLSDNFKIIIQNSKEKKEHKIPNFVAYSGTLKDNNSLVTLIFINNCMFGSIIDGKKEFKISPSNKNFSLDEYQVYEKNNSNLISEKIICGTNDNDSIINHYEKNKNNKNLQKCVNVHFEITSMLNNELGGNNESISKFLTIFNIVQTAFLNENINLKLSYLKIWNSADPYFQQMVPNENYADLGLNSFYSNNINQINGNIGMLLTNYNAGISGIAKFGFIPNYDIGKGYASTKFYSPLNTSQWYNEYNAVIISHEIGHTLGSNHTHWCGWTGGPIDNCSTPEGNCTPGPNPINGGTIMSYCNPTSGFGVMLSNGFGILPGDVIRDNVTNSQSITNCNSGDTCNENILQAGNIEFIGSNSIKINWTSNYPVKIYFKESAQTSFSLLSTVNPPSNNFIYTIPTINTDCLNDYYIKLIAICPNGESKPSEIIFKYKNDVNPYTNPFIETFNSSLCNLGYLNISGTNLVNSGELLMFNFRPTVLSKGIYLNSGNTINVSLKIKHEISTTYYSAMKISIGASQNVANHTLLGTFVPNNNNYVNLFFQFTPSSTGLHYISFQGMNDVYPVGLYKIDDLSISTNLNTNDNELIDYPLFYPNPSSDYINFYNQYSEVEILDTSGRIVFKNNNFQKQLNVSNLPKGMYIITVKTKDGLKKLEKFMKK